VIEVSFEGLLVVAIVAAAAPLLIGLAPRLRVPSVVLEIVAGILVGPAVLGWVEVDAPITVLSLLGLAFLLLLSGLELDLRGLLGPRLRAAGLGYLATLVLGVTAGLVFTALGWTASPWLVAIALSATSLGLVVPVLKDAGQLDREVGQLTVAGASVADFGAILLLSFFFSTSSTSARTKGGLLVGLALLAVVAVLALTRLGRSMRAGSLLVRLQDTTAEIRVRLAVVLLVVFVALADSIGLEFILGAFIAGAVLGLIDRDTMSHPHFRLKLEAIGFGLLVPVFFVASGLRFDLESLLSSPAAFARVPVFLLALLVIRGLPAALYAGTVGRREAVAAALLQATSLPFIVAAIAIGLDVGELSPETGSALVAAGLVSVVVFPPIALRLLRTGGTPDAVVPRQPASRVQGAGQPS
jgi:Kef-type K+ transport system membrane component KefB